MSTNKTKNQKDKSNLIICKNCCQEILKDKMFLHEGFCLRNNSYCEHCEKVFLKKDYEEHIKNIPKNLSKQKSDSQSQSQKSPETRSESVKPNSTTEHNDSMNNLNDNIESLYPTPSLEFVQMPPTELFHINNPIIISENGQIVSDKNKNEFLLPYLGINFFQNSKKSDEILDGIINQGEIFKENNTISRNSYKIEDLEKLLSSDCFDNNKLNNKVNIRERNNSNYSSDQLSNNKILRLSEKINEYHQNKSNKSKSFVNNINYNDTSLNCNNPIIGNNNLDGEKDLKNNIIINNNIITYNSNKNINKIHNIFSPQETHKKPIIINSLKKTNNNEVFEAKPSIKDSIKSHRGQIKNNINNYFENNILGKKEPKDSNSKKNQLFQSSGQKSKKNTIFKPLSENGKKKMSIKKCEYCNILFNIDEANIHYKNCKMKKEKKKKVRKFDIPKPKKKETIFLTDNFPSENIDEKGLDDKKRETLHRKFNAALNVISLNNDRRIDRGVISNPDRKSKNDIIIKENKITSLKKKLFNFNDENNQNNIKKDFPEDSMRYEKISKTQKRIYRIKRINNLSVDGNNIDLINNYIKGIKNKRTSEQQMGYNVLNTEVEIDPFLYFYDNFNINKIGH